MVRKEAKLKDSEYLKSPPAILKIAYSKFSKKKQSSQFSPPNSPKEGLSSFDNELTNIEHYDECEIESPSEEIEIEGDIIEISGNLTPASSKETSTKMRDRIFTLKFPKKGVKAYASGKKQLNNYVAANPNEVDSSSNDDLFSCTVIQAFETEGSNDECITAVEASIVSSFSLPSYFITENHIVTPRVENSCLDDNNTIISDDTNVNVNIADGRDEKIDEFVDINIRGEAEENLDEKAKNDFACEFANLIESAMSEVERAVGSIYSATNDINTSFSTCLKQNSGMLSEKFEQKKSIATSTRECIDKILVCRHGPSFSTENDNTEEHLKELIDDAAEQLKEAMTTMMIASQNKAKYINQSIQSCLSDSCVYEIKDQDCPKKDIPNGIKNSVDAAAEEWKIAMSKILLESRPCNPYVGSFFKSRHYSQKRKSKAKKSKPLSDYSEMSASASGNASASCNASPKRRDDISLDETFGTIDTFQYGEENAHEEEHTGNEDLNIKYDIKKSENVIPLAQKYCAYNAPSSLTMPSFGDNSRLSVECHGKGYDTKGKDVKKEDKGQEYAETIGDMVSAIKDICDNLSPLCDIGVRQETSSSESTTYSRTENFSLASRTENLSSFSKTENLEQEDSNNEGLETIAEENTYEDHRNDKDQNLSTGAAVAACSSGVTNYNWVSQMKQKVFKKSENDQIAQQISVLLYEDMNYI
uniref:Uncharacterized protein n=1 Tax=Corethron hystrix TaxID=216773 RepID=A0A7S1BDJ4_9STRA|mmetsp:Transcript_21341/g.48477  ORF Transcript_21341/g.48477 Transcript_21341/m.48477 type:complete len:702 (+) Transcript_21341:196-2301(+)|eukprot:CAMPEP_0113315948 /NCGR_PEP_ID=MMETSP0010_2-20120614/11409_1 /TAXON_ID=216773 ORGANISM="Corethron hystrix, Strain 308" /NCGR_SAMPLE_ID=MMETSP0010_2 /ASSEMBLY_ACC=CAM_ASM_000155 /LENGTH=701 /DNA_ID=CAMNT_0000172545 /DNA_START=74 /DNA_END=2179 /DNA_ORIENTATION=+ /assembly_acc=CAM_ASM_000155